MCTALEDFKKEGIKEGVLIGTIRTCKKLNISSDTTIEYIIDEFSFSREEAQLYINLYW